MKPAIALDRKVCGQSWAKSWASSESTGLTSSNILRLRAIQELARVRATLYTFHQEHPGFYQCSTCAGRLDPAGCPSCDGEGQLPAWRIIDTLFRAFATSVEGGEQ
jgi:hypothetical protein